MTFSLPRFYPILDSDALTRCSIPLRAAANELLAAGVKILQIRHKGHWTRQLFADAEQIAQDAKRANCLLVINDRADIAALLDAALHVGQDDLPPALARRVLGPPRVLGFSTHNAEQLSAGDQEPVSYLAIGPVFGTQSKQDPDPVVGLERLAELRSLTRKPLVAIGGITPEAASAVWAAGADSIAVISGLLQGAGTPQDVRRNAENWMRLGP